jgi:hypothetical protein
MTTQQRQPSYGPVHAGPPPMPSYPPRRQRRGGWIALGALLIAVALAAAAGAMILADDSGEGGVDERPGSDLDEPADSIVGDGYSYAIPDGWTEISELPDIADSGVSESGELLDPVAVVVSIEPADGAKTPMAVWSETSDAYQADYGRLPTIHTGPKIDGQETVLGRIEVEVPDVGPESHAFYVTRHEGRVYSITVMSATPLTSTAEAAFDDITATWSWQ